MGQPSTIPVLATIPPPPPIVSNASSLPGPDWGKMGGRQIIRVSTKGSILVRRIHGETDIFQALLFPAISMFVDTATRARVSPLSG